MLVPQSGRAHPGGYSWLRALQQGGQASLLKPPGPQPSGPQQPPPGIIDRNVNPNVPARPGMNPYTGQPLAANEYVGVAGSEAQNPGMVRIPPPGWWDPSNPNYERRNYYQGPKGQTVAREAGFDPGEEDPWDTGRAGEVNAEHEGKPGWTNVMMSEPGVPRWRQGQERPKMPGYPGADPQSGSGVQHPSVLGALTGQNLPQHPADLGALLGTNPPQHPSALGALGAAVPTASRAPSPSPDPRDVDPAHPGVQVWRNGKLIRVDVIPRRRKRRRAGGSNKPTRY